jgi:phosphohistidine phosphatase
MLLYLVRHGEAESKASDPTRPLTDRGRADVAEVAAFVRRLGIDVHQIRHSGKRRAEETAAIMSRSLKPSGGTVAMQGLNPMDDVEPMAESLRGLSSSLMLVGHCPFLERLAGLLLAGDSAHAMLHLQPGGIACLEREPVSRTWSAHWLLTPEVIRAR